MYVAVDLHSHDALGARRIYRVMYVRSPSNLTPHHSLTIQFSHPARHTPTCPRSTRSTRTVLTLAEVLCSRLCCPRLPLRLLTGTTHPLDLMKKIQRSHLTSTRRPEEARPPLRLFDRSECGSTSLTVIQRPVPQPEHRLKRRRRFGMRKDDEDAITATDAQAEDVEDVEENSASCASTARDNAEHKPSPAPTQQYKSEKSASYSPRERHKVERSSRSHSRSNATWTFTFSINSHRSSHRDGHPSTRDRSRHHRGEPPATRASQRSSTFGDSAYSSVSSVAPYLIGAGAAFILSNRSAITNGLSAWTNGR